MNRTPTIGSAVIDRLHQLGVRHIFGIPGDYVLSLYQLIEASPIQHVGTTREDCAGFAADAYARINGIGAVCVTYCVGGLNTVNAIACAYAERSPVVLLKTRLGDERFRARILHEVEIEQGFLETPLGIGGDGAVVEQVRILGLLRQFAIQFRAHFGGLALGKLLLEQRHIHTGEGGGGEQTRNGRERTQRTHRKESPPLRSLRSLAAKIPVLHR